MQINKHLSNSQLTQRMPNQLLFVLLKLVGIVFACFFSFGAAIAIIPMYIKTELQFSGLVIGFIIALQYLSTLLSRAFAGNIADAVGAKTAVKWGLLMAIACGLMYAGCVMLQSTLSKLAFIAAGRIILGISESLIITGTLAWALNQAGSAHAGKIMAWNGNAMYGGVALGALGGGWLMNNGGFLWVTYVAIALPVLALLSAQSLQVQPVSDKKRLPFYKVVHNIALPGTGLLLATVGYGVILTFIGLFFQSNGWPNAERGIAVFGAAYILARLLFSGLPDRHGGAKVAFYSMIIECLGQGLIYISTQHNTVLLGCLLSGFGFSLVVPSLGLEAIKRTPLQNRGAAMGGFLAFFDLSFCIAIPIAGAITNGNNYQVVYFIGTSAALMGVWIAWKLLPYKSLSESDEELTIYK